MKVKYEFAVREVVGEYVLIPLGIAALEFGGMITTNEVGAFLWEHMKGEFEIHTLVEAVHKEFEVDREQAHRDVAEFIEYANKRNLIIG